MRIFIFISLALFLLLTSSCKKDDLALKNQFVQETLSAKSGGGSTVNLTKELIAYYPFDGNAKDLSGNGFNGINNGATNTTNRFGQKNRAFYFNNADITSNLNNNQFKNDFSFSIWVKSDLTTTPYPTIIDGANQYLTIQYGTHISTNPILALFYFSDGIGTGITYGGVSGVIDESKWNHIAIKNSNYITSIYINGTLIQTNSSPTPNQCETIGSFMKIGNGIQLPQCAFKGKLDDLRIYNRALNDSEISYLAKN